MTTAVTAATGHLGRLVIDELLARVPATEVVAVARDATKAADLADLGVTVRIADYDDGRAMQEALAGVQRLLLISGSEPGRRSKQHATVIDAAIAAGVEHISYTSILGAESSTLALAGEHVDTEAHLREVGVAHTLLRNGWYHENYAPTLQSAGATGTVLTSVQHGLVASAPRADYARAAAVVLTTATAEVEDVYELSGDDAWPQEVLAAAVAEVIGKPVTVTRVSTQEHVAALQRAGLDEGTASFVAGIDTGTDHGDLAIQTGQLAALIGRPTGSLIDSLRPLA